MDGQGELDFALRYPFSSPAKALLRARGARVDERLVELALQRIKQAMEGKLAKSSAIHDERKYEEISTYAVARMVLGHLRNNYITNKFAVEESKRVHSYLNSEPEETVRKVGEGLGVEVMEEGGRLSMDIPVFLSYAPKSVHYRLINREIAKGRVAVNKEEVKRLIEEAVRKRMERMPLVKDPPDMIKKAGKELLEMLPKPKLPAVNAKPGDHPPCVEKLLEAVKKHQNLPHTARWFLVTYFIAIGMNDDQITAMYSNLPDFSERITRYQVEHARKKGYSVPSCATVNTYGYCVANCRIGIPIHWHTRNDRRAKA
jgi:DNA primase large subunit